MAQRPAFPVRRARDSGDGVVAGSNRRGKAMAFAFTLNETTKANRVDPQAWLTDVLSRIDELLLWNYLADE
jgi:transposase